MLPFKFKAYDLHEKEDGPCLEDGWMKFDYILEVSEVQISAFREHVLFDKENNPLKCVLVMFNDGDEAYACGSLNRFQELYEKEYDPLYKQYLKLDFLRRGIVYEPDVQPVQEAPAKRPWWRFGGGHT